MGFDPQAVLAFLQAAGGNASGFTNPPDQNTAPARLMQTPQALPPQLPAATPQPQPPTPQPQSQPGPQLTGIKGYLSNILYNMGEAAKAHLGMPTDVQVQQNQQKLNIEQQKANAETIAQQSEAEYRKTMTAMNAPAPIMDPREAEALGMNVGDMISPAAKYAILKERIQNQGKMSVAQIGANARLGAAQIQALSRMSQTTMKAAYLPDGTLGVGLYDKAGNFKGYADNAVVPPGYLEKIHHGQEFKVDADGTLQVIPTITTSSPLVPRPPASNQLIPGPTAPAPGQPVQNILQNGAPPPNQAPLPGAPKSPVINQLRKGAATASGQATPAASATPVTSNGKPMKMSGATQMMVGPDSTGKQVAGTPQELKAAGISDFTKLDASSQDKVITARQLTGPGGLFSLVDQDLAKFKPGELEGLAPRWNEFLAGTIGTADPRYVALRTHLNGLLGTAMMQAHVGARGGENMMEHFEDIANAGKMSQGTLRAALTAERQYVEEKAMRPNVGQPNTPPPGARIRDYTQIK